MVKGRAKRLESVLAVILAGWLALPPQAGAQQPGASNPAGPPQSPVSAPPAAPAGFETRSLRIFVLEGQGAIHNIRERAATSPVVEVRDESGLPVEGATVTFALPAAGPGGSFPGQKSTATVQTNLQGQAATTFMPNLETGPFNIKVTAQIGNRTGTVVIRQRNSSHEERAATEAKSGIFKFAWWKVAVLAGVGATIGVLVATRGGSGSSVRLIPGSPTFGAP